MEESPIVGNTRFKSVKIIKRVLKDDFVIGNTQELWFISSRSPPEVAQSLNSEKVKNYTYVLDYFPNLRCLMIN